MILKNEINTAGMGGVATDGGDIKESVGQELTSYGQSQVNESQQ